MNSSKKIVLNDDERAMIRAFRQLNEDDKQQVRKYLGKILTKARNGFMSMCSEEALDRMDEE